ncbi:MAG: hypothetical protein H6741_09480 [Alphaproteobacteria bacterium]|nr:hypothetical protein [Alphaproteobacteria bacterium]MCB9792945.1 hypothetical protein [Alphaproteobacteria bacterium]
MRRVVLALTVWNALSHLMTMSFFIWGTATAPIGREHHFVVATGLYLGLAWAVSTPFTTLIAAVLNHWRARLPALTLFNVGAGLFWLPSLSVLAAATCAC